jgi:hypothetical protein
MRNQELSGCPAHAGSRRNVEADIGPCFDVDAYGAVALAATFALVIVAAISPQALPT